MSGKKYEKKAPEAFDPNQNYQWRDSFATNQEFVNDYIHRHPTHDFDDYMGALADSINRDFNLKGADIIEVNAKTLADAYTNKAAGVAIGATAKNKKELTLKSYDNNISTYDITRMTTDNRFIIVGERSVQKYGASVKNVTNGDVFGANAFEFLPNRRQTSTAPTISPEESAAREAALLQQNKEMAVESDIFDDLDAKVVTFTEALVTAEVRGLKEINIAKGVRGSDLAYPQKKHSETHPRDIDEYYKNAFAMPNNYNFLSIKDPTDHPDVKNITGNEHSDILARARKINELTDTNLETLAAHLKVVDEKTSPEDDPHPLIVAYEEEYGPVRDLTAKEFERINYLEGKVPPIPEDDKDYTEDGEEIVPPFFGGDIFVGSIKVSDFGNREAPISSGQVFYADRNYKDKYNVKNNSLMGTVNVVGGDPHADVIDEIILVEGAATAASVQEIMDESDRLGLTNYKDRNVLVLSTYNAANFVHVAKEIYKTYPDVPTTALSDQDIKVKLEGGGGRPELDEKGGYLYLTSDGTPPLRESELPKTQAEQMQKLRLNQGLDSTYKINKFIVDNPNYDSEGKVILPQMSAIVINKGKGGLASQIIPQLSPDNAGKTITERRLDPKVDVNDVVERGKKVVEQALTNLNKQRKENDQPQITVGERTMKVKESLAQILQATIIAPAKAMTEALQKKVASNIDSNHYVIEAEKAAAAEKEQQAAREALKEQRAALRQAANTNSNSNSGGYDRGSYGGSNDDATRDKPSFDRVEAGKRDPDLENLANKYGGGFIDKSESNNNTAQKTQEQTRAPINDTPAVEDTVKNQPPQPAYTNSMRP